MSDLLLSSTPSTNQQNPVVMAATAMHVHPNSSACGIVTWI